MTLRSETSSDGGEASTKRLELIDAEGKPWVFEVSESSARFIGCYVRVAGFGSAGQFLDFLPGAAAPGRAD